MKYYVARWYDSEIGHFIQADSVVPGAGNPLAWNRYAYVKYNPLKYVDPSGKTDIINPHNDNGVFTDSDPRTIRQQIEQIYGFTFIGHWTEKQARTIWDGIIATQIYLDGLGKNGLEWIKNNLNAKFVHGTISYDGLTYHYVFGNTIQLGMNFDITRVVHEFAHVLDNKIGYDRRVKMYQKAQEYGNYDAMFLPLDATIVGGGLADDLFIAMGGIPWGPRFRNGSSDYNNDEGVMASLPLFAQFPKGQYGNAGSAEYLAETWTAAILGD